MQHDEMVVQAKRFIRTCPDLYKALDEYTDNGARAPIIERPEPDLEMTCTELLAFKLGQRSIIKWLSKMASGD